MTDQNNTTPEAANDADAAPAVETPRSVYDALVAAGHSDNEINGHLFACACTMTLLRNSGMPPQLGIPIVARVTAEKLRVNEETALLVMRAVIEGLRGDAKFAAAVNAAVARVRTELSELLG